MKQVIEKIKSKPVHQQNRIILFTIITVVVLLLVAWAIIGIPKRKGANPNADLINQFNTEYNESKNTLPDLFPKN